jgi:hypothetical protein
MFNRFAGLVLAALLSATCAQATEYKATFTAADFHMSNGLSAPDSIVSGSFDFSAATASSLWDAIHGIDLVINGHRYGVGDVGVGAGSKRTLVGGNETGALTISSYYNDDFLLLRSGEGFDFYYSIASANAIWLTSNVTMSIKEVSAVPEPETYAMLLAGLGLMGAVVRRRKA